MHHPRVETQDARAVLPDRLAPAHLELFNTRARKERLWRLEAAGLPEGAKFA